LSHGTIHWLSDDNFEERIAEFDTLVYYAPTEAEEGVRSRRRAATTFELANSDGPKEIAELQWRLLLPVTAFFMTLVAIELARALPARVRIRAIAGLVTRRHLQSSPSGAPGRERAVRASACCGCWW
jgi:lipopolysaccharide export system permease protein